MAVALRGRGRGRVARHRRGAWRDNHRRFWMALGNAVVNAVLVVSAVGGERGHRARDLVEQGANLGAVVDLLGGQRRGDDLAALGIHADVQFSPRPARLGAVLFQQPLARAAQAQTRAVHQQMQGFAASARLRVWHRQRRSPAAQGGMVRHAQREPKQVDDGADQALGLAQRQAEHRAQGEGCQDGERRVAGLPAWGGAGRCPPGFDCFVREPYGEAAALAQGCVIGSRVGDPVFLPRDMVSAVLVQLERRWASRVRSGASFLRQPTRLHHKPPPCNMLSSDALRQRRSKDQGGAF